MLYAGRRLHAIHRGRCRDRDDPAARAAVLAGERSILGAAKTATSETLAEHFARSAPSEWLEAAREIGPGIIWDHMVAPLIA